MLDRRPYEAIWRTSSFVSGRSPSRSSDFLIAAGRKPRLLVETKLSDDRPSAALRKLQDQVAVPAVQLVNAGSEHRIYANEAHKILVAPAWQWLARLPW